MVCQRASRSQQEFTWCKDRNVRGMAALASMLLGADWEEPIFYAGKEKRVKSHRQVIACVEGLEIRPSGKTLDGQWAFLSFGDF